MALENIVCLLLIVFEDMLVIHILNEAGLASLSFSFFFYQEISLFWKWSIVMWLVFHLQWSIFKITSHYSQLYLYFKTITSAWYYLEYVSNSNMSSNRIIKIKVKTSFFINKDHIWQNELSWQPFWISQNPEWCKINIIQNTIIVNKIINKTTLYKTSTLIYII